MKRLDNGEPLDSAGGNLRTTHYQLRTHNIRQIETLAHCDGIQRYRCSGPDIELSELTGGPGPDVKSSVKLQASRQARGVCNGFGHDSTYEPRSTAFTDHHGPCFSIKLICVPCF